MRNGNVAVQQARRQFRSGSYRTYEEWKRIHINNSVTVKISFLPYLWGMETENRLRNTAIMMRVLTVPMRNGNAISICGFCLTQSGSYRTYEEWKHDYGKEYMTENPGSYRTYEEWKLRCLCFKTFHPIKVLTVPMRNGNWHTYFLPCASSTFLPYLWGMETV